MDQKSERERERDGLVWCGVVECIGVEVFWSFVGQFVFVLSHVSLFCYVTYVDWMYIF